MDVSSQINDRLYLLGKVILSGKVILKTGLLIGASDSGITIGDIDKFVIRNSMDKMPYIPGSSLKGKMRSLLERAFGKPQNTYLKRGRSRTQQILYHTCRTQKEYNNCSLCNLFGIPADQRKDGVVSYPTRIIVRDAMLANADDLRDETDLLYTEAKTEVGIDRLTSVANPRYFERVPAGAKFNFEIIVNCYLKDDQKLLDLLLTGMGLLQDDYLGGQGSRGYGHIKFSHLDIKLIPLYDSNFVVMIPDWVKQLDGSTSMPDWKPIAAELIANEK